MFIVPYMVVAAVAILFFIVCRFMENRCRKSSGTGLIWS